MNEPRPFFGRIESLRGIGALFVAGYHLSGWVFFPGHAALMMFFAISGCVLYISLQYGPQNFSSAAARFFVARIFRIYPIVFFGVLFAAWVAVTWGVGLDALSAGDGAGEIVANMLLLKATVNPTLWALQLEAVMAPIILLLFFLERAYGTKILLAIGILATALTFTNWALWKPLSNNLYPFVLGMLIPTLGRRWASGLSQPAANAWFVGAIAVMFASGPVLGFYSHWAGVAETYAALVLLSIAAFRSDVVGSRFLESWPVRQLGLSSGSYYVLHIPLLVLAGAVFSLVVPPEWSAQAPVLVKCGQIVILLAAIAPICLLSYHLVEAPGIALGRRVLRGRRAVPAE